MVAHLIEFDRRKLYAPLGFSSLFVYCVRELGYSEDVAFKRICAARAAATFPMILPLLETGELHLTGLALIARHLNAENHRALIDGSRNRSRREIESLVAALAPEAEESDLLRAIRTNRVVVRFCADERFKALLERARGLLRHKHPDGRFENVLSEALELLLSQQDLAYEPKKRRRNSLRTSSASRHIPKWIKNLVWNRDGGRCAFIAEDGRRCEERSWLEFDHIVPWALGGSSTNPDNIRLLCWAHNQMMAREVFGDALIAQRQNGSPSRDG